MASSDEMFLVGPTDTALPPAKVVSLTQENSTLKSLEWWEPRNPKFQKRAGVLTCLPFLYWRVIGHRHRGSAEVLWGIGWQIWT